VKSNFERLFNRLETINPKDIDDKRYWHGVTPQNYDETLDAARSSMDEIIEMVDTDCTLWLEPPTEKTAFEIERSDHHRKKSSKDRPSLKFQCGNNLMLQDKPCSNANLCLVRSAERQWIQWYRKEASSSSYDHTDLQMKLSPRVYANDKKSSAPKSAILTMVDSVKYLISGKYTGKKKHGKSYYIWECFLNKAAYALRTNREFYIWIGGLEEETSSDATTNSTTTKLSGSPPIPILHQRNTRTISRTFGAKCNPEIPHKNVVHYYKPIAFGALFRKLREKQQPQNGLPQQHQNVTAWFVDADIFFNHEAFPQVAGYNSSIINDDDGSPPSSLSIDDYFEISPQAAMLGSQNPSDKDDNILMNGGLIGLRGSATNPGNLLDDWVMNLSALWWYCRCGERDQIALWLLLFATWSAASPESSKFRYPGVIFENYLFSWHAVIPHARESLPLLQTSWGDNKDLWSTAPANPNKPLDGGKSFVERGTYTAPLELPHVLLLPLDPFVVNATSNHRSHFDLGIARKNQHEKKALLSHTKNVLDVCYDFKCWPYLIRKDPRAGHPSSNEGNDDEEEEENGSTEINDEEESNNSNTEDDSADNTSVENSNTSEEDEIVPDIINH